MKQFYLYFPNEERAREAAVAVAALGYGAAVRVSADETTWLLLATAPSHDRAEPTEAEEEYLDEIAVRFTGEYDGWEVDSIPEPEPQLH